MVVADWHSVYISLGSGLILLYLSWQIYHQKRIVGHFLFWKLILLFSIICLIFGINNIGLLIPGAGHYPLSLHLYLLYFGSFYFIPVLWVFYCLHFTGREDLVTMRNGILISIIPSIMIILRAEEFWNVFQSVNTQTLLSGISTSFFGLGYFYLYCLVFLGMILLIRQYRNVSDKIRYQIVFLVTGMAIPLIVDFFTEGNFLTSGLDVAVSGFFLAFGIQYCDMLIYSPVFREHFFDIIDAGLLVMNSKGEILDMNHTAEMFLNVKRNDVFTKKPSEFDSIPTEFRVILSDPKTIKEHYHFSVSYPEVRWFAISSRWAVKRFSSGGVFLVMIHDITRNVTLEKEVSMQKIQGIREKERIQRDIQYHLSFSGSHDARILIEKGSIVAGNPAAQALFQMQEAEMKGMDPMLLSARVQKNPDDVQEKLHYSIAVASSGKAVRLTWMFVTAGGREFEGDVELCRIICKNRMLVEMTIMIPDADEN